MRLFRYISGANEAEQKIAMTTPVFMEGQIGESNGTMGFVMPKEVAAEGVPDPKGEGVKIRTRKGGRFAVIRFSGRLDGQLAKQQEAMLRRLAWHNICFEICIELALDRLIFSFEMAAPLQGFSHEQQNRLLQRRRS